MEIVPRVAKPPAPCNPYRFGGSNREPSVEEVAAGIVARPELLAEIARRLAWTDPETLDRFEAAIAAARRRREYVTEAVREGRVGERLVGK